MVEVPCHRCLMFTEEKSLTGYLTSFVPSNWDFYEMRIKLCPRCVAEWVVFSRSLHLEDLRIGKEKHVAYDPKITSHIHMLIFKDWFLRTKSDKKSVSEMYRKKTKEETPKW